MKDQQTETQTPLLPGLAAPGKLVTIWCEPEEARYCMGSSRYFSWGVPESGRRKEQSVLSPNLDSVVACARKVEGESIRIRFLCGPYANPTDIPDPRQRPCPFTPCKGCRERRGITEFRYPKDKP